MTAGPWGHVSAGDYCGEVFIFTTLFHHYKKTGHFRPQKSVGNDSIRSVLRSFPTDYRPMGLVP